jgi:hypoxanthine phosphoribosyltransferase
VIYVGKGLTESKMYLSKGILLAGDIVYEVPTWSQIYDLVLNQTKKIRQSGYVIDVVVGLSRGGLVPARIICDLLEVPELVTIQIEFYTDIARTANEPVLRQPLAVSVDGKSVLLVDDIADSGKSLNKAISYLKGQGIGEVKTATLYYKPQSLTMPDFYERQTLNWIVFPWDTKETLRKIILKAEGRRALNHEIAKLVKAGLPKPLTEKLLSEMQQGP